MLHYMLEFAVQLSIIHPVLDSIKIYSSFNQNLVNLLSSLYSL
jgi:hypothetical protein